MSRIVLLALLSVAAAAFAGEPQPREAAINLTPGAPPPSPELVATLAGKDRQLFDAVFGCKPELLETLVAEDFEFFHDKHGLTTQSGAQFVKDITGMCERQAAGTDFRARRELVAGSMTVHVIGATARCRWARTASSRCRRASRIASPKPASSSTCGSARARPGSWRA